LLDRRLAPSRWLNRIERLNRTIRLNRMERLNRIGSLA